MACPSRFPGPSSCVVVVLLAAASLTSQAVGQALPAFPGAEGVGGTATGGRGYTVYHVTTLANSGPGSFRDAVSQSNRMIVFDVGGTIRLGPDPTTNELLITANNIIIAGQTAPGDGIFIYGQGLKFGSTAGGNSSNVVVRNLHVRAGEDPFGRSGDSITLNSMNSIIDHCSVQWASDELLSGWHGGGNNTVQYCIVAEALNYAGHGYASLVGSDNDDVLLSYHHNLYAHFVTRGPRLGNEVFATNYTDWRNNVMYNWQNDCGYTSGASEGWGNFIGNYYVAGNDTSSGDRMEAFNGGSTNAHLYQSGNKIDGDRDGVFDGTDTGWSMFTGTYTKESAELPAAPVCTQSADNAIQTVLTYVGANWWNRDSVDGRIVNDVYTGGGTIKNWITDVGGLTYYPEVHRPAGFDTDNDGMPNTWETARGLDPNLADNNGDYDADGYTNIEEYLNELAAFPAPKAIVWIGGDGRFELTNNWDLWQPSMYDQAEINSGTSTVAYIGQQAGTLYLANTTGSTGELAITTGGQLTIADRLVLGNAAGARGTASVSGGTLTAGGAIVLASASSSTGLLSVSKDAHVEVGGLIVNTGGGRSSTVGAELDGNTQSLIHTTAASTLGGVMDVQVLDGYRPREGDTFVVISSTDPNGVYFVGNFDTFTSNITYGLPPASSAFGGAADGADYDVVFLGYTYGDANGDHSVDGGDLALMGGNWNQPVGGWANCDFNDDGVVNGGDLALMGGEWMWSLPGGAPSVPIPEPLTAVLLSLGSLAAWKKRRRS